jgi:hypothetical protein
MFVGGLNLGKRDGQLIEASEHYEQYYTFCPYLFYISLSNKHCYAAIFRFESGSSVSVVRLAMVDIAQ